MPFTDYLEHTCDDCRFFTGEECDGGIHEGRETYGHEQACMDWEPVGGF